MMDYRLRQNIDQKLLKEVGTVFKTANNKISIALIYPNTYYVGMSNLGFQTIYGLLNDRSDVVCERVFLPDRDVLAYYESTQTPLCSLESKTAVLEFDIIAFSVSFENDYLNMLRILELARIPLTSEQRESCKPLVILGGAVTAINPEPLAMFIDLFVIGDGEKILTEIVQGYRQAVNSESKQALLECLAEIPGVYVPSFYDITYDSHDCIERIVPRLAAPECIEKYPVYDLDEYPAYSRILTEQTEFGKMFLIQINRGCCYRCRFCHTGYTQTPLRQVSLDTAVGIIQQGLEIRNRIGIVGAAVAEYPYLRTLCETIFSQGGTISVSSLRISALSRSEYLLEALQQSGQKTVTMAPEAGTERLRKIIRKDLSNTLLYNTVARVISQDIPNLKLYFLIGLPTETADDIDAIVDVCKTCRQLMLKTAKLKGKIGKITISVNPFVPKPFTPLQWCPMNTEAELKRKIRRLKRTLQRIGNVEVIYELPKQAIWQGILARGDRKLGAVLRLTAAYQGDWKKAFRELHLSPGFYVHRTRAKDEKFPWSHLNVGLSHEILLDEYQRILATGSQ